MQHWGAEEGNAARKAGAKEAEGQWERGPVWGRSWTYRPEGPSDDGGDWTVDSEYSGRAWLGEGPVVRLFHRASPSIDGPLGRRTPGTSQERRGQGMGVGV